jgi:hypothetical protein
LARATEFVFDQIYSVTDPSLRQAQSLENSCASLRVRFRLNAKPQSEYAALKDVAAMREAGYRYYFTAASSDYGVGHIYWDPRVMCASLANDDHLEGLYLHEIISAQVGSAKRGFDDRDWTLIGSYAACAQASHKKILWSEWAGGSWGWATFQRQTSAPRSLAHRTLNAYRDVFVFLWANNRDVRRDDQRRDMLDAQAAVSALGNPENGRLQQALTNPIQAVFPHGISIQDWYWYETHRDSEGKVDPQVMAQMPATMVTEFGVNDFAKGGRYFQFEAYWSGQAQNSSGTYYPGFFKGITQLRDYIIGQSGHCTQ